MSEYIGKHRPSVTRLGLDKWAAIMSLSGRRDGFAIAKGQHHIDSIDAPRHNAEFREEKAS